MNDTLRHRLIELFRAAFASDIALGQPQTAWSYRRPAGSAGIELAAWNSGSSPVSSAHFHDEIQATWVIGGRRELNVAGCLVEISAGECLVIPRGVPHAAVGTPSATISLNIYLPADAFHDVLFAPVIVDLLERTPAESRCSLVAPLLDFGSAGDTARLAQEMIGTSVSISAIAARMGRSRAALTREFSCHVGMSPHAYRLAHRLNHARRLLRQGGTIADVAAAAGFADQSHLGRLFRRSFGTTPARYRRA